MATMDSARELLRDLFTRQVEHVDDLTENLTDDVALYRPTPEANTITWLIWHTARMQDAQVCDIAGMEQVWFRDGWVDRFGLDLPRDAHGYGHTPDEVAKVRAPAALLAGYYRAVHKLSLEYVASVSEDELARVIDKRWTPPVTASARLVSIIDDAAQHLGQAAYIRGLVS
nr:mycothiol transferase [Mycolicibacterium iranicum]